MSKALYLSKFQASRLPEGYTEVEYIESSGTQYINTGFKANQDTRVVIDFMYLSGDVIFGAYDSGGANGFGLQCASGKWYTYYGTSSDYGVAATANVRCVVDINKNVATIDGATLRTATPNTFQGSNPLLLSTNYNVSSAQFFSSIRLYACQIFDNGTLIRNFVPCANPDGAIGLYDMVTRVFFANVGTGVFTAGEESTEISADNYARKVTKPYLVMDSVTKKTKKGYTVQGSFTRRGLPNSYTQVEYIESSGTQYIDTGFKPNQDTRVVMDAEFVDMADDVSAAIAVFGVRDSATWLELHKANTSNWYFRFFWGTTYSQYFTIDYAARYTFEVNRNVATVGNMSITYPTETFQLTKNLYLSAWNQNGTAGAFANLKIYSCQIYDNDILIRDYVPCVNSDSVAGLYDMANGIFYGNAGTGTFVVGSTYKNITRLFYSAYINPFVSYSGAYTTREITDSAGTPYTLYTLTGSGNLVLSGDVQYWMCGGGSRGNSGYWGSGSTNSSYGAGGGGAGAYVFSTNLDLGEYTVTIGSGNGGKSSITKNTSAIGTAAGGGASTTSSIAGYTKATGCNGGSGGGGAYIRNDYSGSGNSTYRAPGGGTGAGVSTIPFGIASLKKHCAGGTGGSNYSPYYGGAGGSNGGGGGASSSTLRGSADYGGGIGGNVGGSGGAATFYGSGGGGAGVSESTSVCSGGSGYQGVAYILVPAAA